MARHHQVLFCLAAAVFLLSAATATADDEAVMSALLSGFSSPPSGWSESTPYCRWTGVKCDASNRVTDINLDNRFLPGTLPADLNKLSELQRLNLRNNSFSGPFPFLSGLASLQEAYLDGNRFDFAPPGFLRGLTGLQGLGLSENPNLPPWSLPTELTESRGLIYLYAANASLTGPLPDIFGSFHELQRLDLSRNNLTGHVPRSISALPRLYSIDMSDNNLTGPMPRFTHPFISIDFHNNPLSFSGSTTTSGLSIGRGIFLGSAAGVVILVLLYVLYKCCTKVKGDGSGAGAGDRVEIPLAS